MRPRAIFISAFNRPKYLRVCLESIAKCKGRGKWDLFVDFDGGSKTDFSVCSDVVSYLSVHRDRNLGCQKHPTEILRIALYFGYKMILYVEDDMLLRSDALNYLLTRETEEGAVSLNTGNGPSACCHCSNSPFTIRAKEMESIIKFMDAKKYLGMNNVLTGKPIGEDERYHDVCWYAWALINKNIVHWAPEQMALNFGHTGMHFNDTEFDKAALSKSPEHWLSDVVAFSTLTRFQKTSRTPGFAYS